MASISTHASDVNFCNSSSTSDVFISTLARAENIHRIVTASDSALPVIVIEDAPINSVSIYSSVIIPKTGQNLNHFHVSITLRGRHRSVTSAAMVDSGATALFISSQFIKKHGMLEEALGHNIKLYNIDGSLNKAGSITHKTTLYLTVGDQTGKWEFLVTDIGPEEVILGLPWLRHTNPAIDWEKGEIRLPPPKEEPEWQPEADVEKIAANRKTRREWLHRKIIQNGTDEVWCLAGYTYSQAIAQKKNEAKGERTYEEMVPLRYRKWGKVFSDEASKRLPKHQPWDHKIDFIPGKKPTWKTRVFPMSVDEKGKLDEFIDDMLERGYIEPVMAP